MPLHRFMLRRISVSVFLIACTLKHGIVSLHKAKDVVMLVWLCPFFLHNLTSIRYFILVKESKFFVCSLLLTTHQAANLITHNKHILLLWCRLQDMCVTILTVEVDTNPFTMKKDTRCILHFPHPVCRSLINPLLVVTQDTNQLQMTWFLSPPYLHLWWDVTW